MLLRQQWYVAAFAHEVTELKALGRRICNVPVVLYRTASGRAVALEDRCSHRGMPLSRNSRCEGETIHCGYHGFAFGPSGTCVGIPSQSEIPENAGVVSYTLVERDAVLWIWMGRRQEADPGKIPDFPFHNDARYRWSSFTEEFHASWLLVLDNLCDMTHISFVHEGISGDPESHLTASVRILPHGRTGVTIFRQLANCKPPAYYLQFGRFNGMIDRWTDYTVTPNLARFWTGATDTGTGAFEGKRDHGINIHSFHGITPMTEDSCYYFFSIGGDFWRDDASVTEKLLSGARAAIVGEDRPILEAQQRRMLDYPDRPFVDVRADAAGVQLRRIINRLHQGELEMAEANA